MEGILPAMILVTAAIIVALIHHRTVLMMKPIPPVSAKPIPPVRPAVIPKPSLIRNENNWVAVMTAVGVWLIWSPILIHWDMPGMNMVLLVLLTEITVRIRLINPSLIFLITVLTVITVGIFLIAILITILILHILESTFTPKIHKLIFEKREETSEKKPHPPIWCLSGGMAPFSLQKNWKKEGTKKKGTIAN